MSLLMFQMQPNAILVVTDTLATSPEGDPHLLVSKATVLPHLDLVIAGTGVAGLIDRWRGIAFSQVLARDVEMLDLHAPRMLRETWSDIASEFGEQVHGATGTVYHFGRSESSGDYLGFAYRSESDFRSERLAGSGFGLKPAPLDGTFEVPASLEELIALAARVRDEQNRLPLPDRVHIGGDLVLVQMQDGIVVSRKLHRFAEFEADWQTMNDRLSAS